MAQTRLERIGTIFTRVKNLIKTGVIKEEDKPLWYDVYKAFPPKYEPRFDRPADMTPVKNIFYEEDKIRAKFHSATELTKINLIAKTGLSQTRHFIHMYEKNEKEAQPGEDVFLKTLKGFRYIKTKPTGKSADKS